MMAAFTEPDFLMKMGFVILLLCFSGFFSGSETALTAASKARIHNAERAGDKRAPIVTRLLGNSERLLGGILLGNNFVNILATSIMTATLLEAVGEAGMIYATIITTVLILVFAEVLPKTYAISQPDKMALRVARPISFVVRVLAPIVAIVQVIVNATLRVFGVDTEAGAWSASDEIRGAVDMHHQEGSVAKRERDQIIGVLELGDLTVEEVMIHRKNLSMIDANAAPEKILKDVLASGHTRLPVWENDPDNVIGILHIKDIMKIFAKPGGETANLNVKKLAREAWFVPETTSVVQQLRAFQQKHEHFALVVDEYGTLMGVITLEDILEEIVGDIQDEYDAELEGVTRQKDGSVIVRGDTPTRDLNRMMGWSLTDEEAVTIAGLVIHESRTIPDEGQTFSYHGHRFTILERERNQIKRLKVSKV
ncbi:MAG: HlyC/CorC family transporter [Maricaulaceae bacterium]